MAKYKADQKVRFTGMTMPATIISGPHPTHGADRWLIRKADETVSLVKERELSPILGKREAAAKFLYQTTGRNWAFVGDMQRDAYLKMADQVIAAIKAADDTATPLTAGDSIRITASGLEYANVVRGDVLKVVSVDPTTQKFRTAALRGPYGTYWSFRLSNEGKGWERA
ncbi:hypothetical protein [Streptomyces rubiginosohelvolus]|uniref:hypothetical protein n=1 Tax=Streptomyces rubiginosohelvolus TaxID=67362 RepID=UPI0033B143E1